MKVTRKAFLLGAAACGTAPSVGMVPAAEDVGARYPGWREGEMDLHFIYTGCGENMFFRLPDGTSVLCDTGEIYRPEHLDRVPLLPSPDRLGGDWVARYIKRVYPEHDIDYAIFTHWHADHIGHAYTTADWKHPADPRCAFRWRKTPDGRVVNGFLCVAEEFGFKRYFDHQYPLRGTYGTADSSMDILSPWVESQKRKGLAVEPFKVGALDQIELLRNPGKYVGRFSVRNICANGVIWDGKDGVRDYAAEHVEVMNGAQIHQNTLSLAFVISYGKFRFYVGGDVGRTLRLRDGGVLDYEGTVGARVGPISLCKMNHHGSADSMDEAFVQAVRAQSYVSCMWCPGHASPVNLSRMNRIGAYDGTRPLFLPTLVCRRHKEEERAGRYEVPPVGAYHVVVKVFPDGVRYRAYLLDPRDEEMRIVCTHDRTA